MTDRELLRLAAIACGELVGEWKNNEAYFDGVLSRWNPLEDDGDALRLVVMLQLGISIPPVVDGRVDVVTFYGPIISIVEYPQNGDRAAAVRRAIVRVAASIGADIL